MRVSSAAWPWVCAAPCEVDSAAVATPSMLDVISADPWLASLTDRAISLVVAACSSTAEAMVVWISEIWSMMPLISVMASTADFVSVWIVSILLEMSSVARGRLLGQLLDLVGHDGEALAGLAGACRLDRGVEREQVGLLGDVGDHLDDLADLGRADSPSLLIVPVVVSAAVDGLAGDLGGVRRCSG